MTLKEHTRQVIFEHDTPAGKAFDIGLIVTILASVLIVILDSVPSFSLKYGELFGRIEWAVTILFTIEYVLRLWSAEDRRAYAFSFFGVVDLLAVIPTYLAILLPQSRFLLVIRILRVLRVFRILKLVKMVGEASVLTRAIRASRDKIFVFIFTVLTIVVVIGSVMYLVEGPEAGFTSIPEGIYWSIVTLTTVGFGDITPLTPLGKALASALMILGYGIIAVPTGIVTMELDRASRSIERRADCPGCGRGGHEKDAQFCSRCGSTLEAGPAGPKEQE